jgi:hypothetical protein
MRTSSRSLVGLSLLSVLALACPRWRGAYADEPAKPEPAKPGEGGGAEEEGYDDPLNDAELVGPLKDRINKAIDKAVPWLISRQKGDGSWGAMDVKNTRVYGGGQGNPYDHPAGPTALALYTLLKCKVPPTHNTVKKGFAWLEKHHRKPKGTYETSVALLAVTATADPAKSTTASETNRQKIRERLSGPMRKWAQDLVSHLLDKHKGRKGWRYQVVEGSGKPQPSHNGDEDSSSTQLAALALFAADRCGVATQTPVWHDILHFAMAQMEADGPQHPRAVHSAKAAADESLKDRARGTAYMKKSPDAHENSAYGSMTACGLASLQIARFVLEQRKDTKWKRDGMDEKVQQAVYDSLAWMDMNWQPFSNPRHPNDREHSYWLYSVERGMDLVGAKRLGKRMWYQELAEQWLGRQNEKGFWDSKSSHDPSDLIDTCWVLLFFRRSTKGAIDYPDVTGGSNEPPVDLRGKKGGP